MMPGMSLAADRWTELAGEARAVAARAWAPYSGFRVGAVLLGADGRVFAGCNVENASYGLTICAERVAFARAVADGCREFAAIVIWTDREVPATPCGACRQVLAELCSDDLEVCLVGRGDSPMRTTLGALLPRAFRAERSQESR